MILGIMQPYFFPYLGYFDLINRSDRWIVFDSSQYMHQGWVNRNRILHDREGWQYIIVPLKKHSRRTAINQVEAVDSPDWRQNIIGRFSHYRRKAPYYCETMTLLEDCLAGNDQNLSRINVRCLGRVCEYLGIAWRPEIFSEMHLSLGPIERAADWALRICEAVGASDYLNPPGGALLYDSARFARHGIRLHIQDDFNFLYHCGNYRYVPKLSIMDVLMWNSPSEILAHLKRNAEAESQVPMQLAGS